MVVDINFWHFILKHLNNSQPVILLCVLESHGSSPGRQGFKMAVTSDEIFGSIGGGIMEYKFVEMAKEKLLSNSKDTLIRKQIHSKSSKINQSGMICSGEQTIALFQLSIDHSNPIKKLINCIENNRYGLLKISNKDFSFSENDSESVNYFQMNSEEDWQYSETIGYKNHLYIIGGGHCALALSKILSQMDFNIHLYDDRKDLNTFIQNTFVKEKKVISDYSVLKNLIPSGNNIFVVIMTFGYRTDDIALRSLIDKDFKYLGVLGSQSKMEKLFEEWRKDNLTEEKLNKLFAPIGVPINSQTPEEIAVSIAAEIISVKNKK